MTAGVARRTSSFLRVIQLQYIPVSISPARLCLPRGVPKGATRLAIGNPRLRPPWAVLPHRSPGCPGLTLRPRGQYARSNCVLWSNRFVLASLIKLIRIALASEENLVVVYVVLLTPSGFTVILFVHRVSEFHFPSVKTKFHIINSTEI